MALELKLDFMYTMPKWQKYAILGGTILAILVLYYFYFYSSTSESLARSIKEKEDLSTKLETLIRMKGEIEKFKAEEKMLLKQYEIQAEILPPSSELPSLLNSVVDLGKSFKVDLKSFTPGILTKGPYYNEMKIALNIQGTYKNVTLFLDNIRRMKRIVNLENLSLSEPKATPEGMLLKGSLSLKIFSRP
ncbi:MAG: hypothetical protein D6734_04075 [Candidatus Schekmanbacteria bacterium]|nr:MAG: hypothetical protein D6734_04075 [Candidatus Schekmanbacteria bacterium]